MRSFFALLGLAFVASSFGQSWQPVATHGPTGAGVPLLLTDGSILVHNANTSLWWKLKPNINGSYVQGTWTQMASLPSGYAPLYYASAVFADGRVFVMGGEYNGSGSAVWTNRGAIYDPIANTWTSLSAPSGWSQIGDAQCTILPNGHLLLAHPFDTLMADLNPATLTWTAVGSGKADRFDEEGWTLLPEGTILTVDAINAPATEKYILSTGVWMNCGNTPQSLVQPSSQEIGPAVLRPNGTVFATGAIGHNAIYTPGATPTSPGTWAAGPDFPNIGGQLDIADGPACLLPSGNVLCDASPGLFNPPSHFFEFNGTTLTEVPAVPHAGSDPSYVGNMLMLPTGQVLFTDFTNDVEIYTPAGSPNNAWRPTITTVPSTVVLGQSYVATGTQFNGLSQCSAYGDDSTNASNYPVIRLTNLATGHVFYCRTFNHSTMAVATGAAAVSTNFAVPSNMEVGDANLEVVANGIPSTGRVVTVTPIEVQPSGFTFQIGSLRTGGLSDLLSSDDLKMVGDVSYINSRILPNLRLDLAGTTSASAISRMDVSVETSGSRTGATQKIYAFDFVGNSWVLFDTSSPGAADSTRTFSITANASRYVSGGQVKVRVEVVDNPSSRLTMNFDYVHWKLYP